MLGISSIALLALIGLILYKLLIAPFLDPLRKLPSPEQPPLRQRLLTEPGPDQLEAWAREVPNDGLIAYYGILNKRKAIHELFQLHPYLYKKPTAVRKILASLLGAGLVTAEGEAHKLQRKAVQPAFKLPRIKNLQSVFWSNTVELIKSLEAATKVDEALNVSPYIKYVTLDVIGIAGMGRDFGCLANPDNELVTDYIRGFEPSADAQKYRALALILPVWLLDRLPLKRNQELRAAVGAVRRRAEQAIKERSQNITDEEQLSGAERQPRDLMSVLMTEGVLDTNSLVDQSLTVLGAVHDTTAMALTWAMFELSKNPSMQDKLRDEVRLHMPYPLAHGAQCSYETFESMQYLGAVVSEAIRLHPHIPRTHRQSLEPTTICGTRLPKGTTSIVSIGGMNDNTKLWKSDPTTFEPCRWLFDKNGCASERNAFMSFSQGTRSCPGETFARVEVKTILAALVACYRITFEGFGHDGKALEPEMEHGITSRLIGGLWLPLEQLDAY